jgi:phosphohistidine phosphatase
MKHLFLIRHAKSSWKERGVRDHERPLAGRGRRQLQLMGEIVRTAGALAGPVFCSTATRARQTLSGLLSHLASPGITFDPDLYTFDYRDLIDWLGRRDEDRLTLIGHNPAFEDLVDHLLTDGPGHLPTCSFLHIELSVHSWNDLDGRPGRLLRFATPKTLAD